MSGLRGYVGDVDRSSVRGSRMRLRLLGGFQLEREGRPVPVPEGSQRLITFLSLRERSLSRQIVATHLWPEATQARALASLRSSLARLPIEARGSLAATSQELGLSDHVSVDLRGARILAQQLLEPHASSPADLGANAISTLSAELLPDSYDDWALIEAEEWRQLRLHALEALADRLSDSGRYGEAAAAGLAAVRAEPLRESPRATLINVHLAEGNPTEALREFSRYDQLLSLELGVGPTARLRSLVADLDAAGR